MTSPDAWLRTTRVRLGLKQEDVETRTAALGDAYRVTQSYLSKLERGLKALSDVAPAKLDALRRVYGLTPAEWTAHTGLHLVTPDDTSERGLAFVRVPVRAGAVAGHPVDDAELVPRDEYRTDMLVLEVHGDSMLGPDGGLRDGDRIYIDTHDLELREGRIYALHVPGSGTVVKRVRKYDGAFWLTSDNPDFPPLRPHRATVLGRVYYHQPRGRRL